MSASPRARPRPTPTRPASKRGRGTSAVISARWAPRSERSRVPGRENAEGPVPPAPRAAAGLPSGQTDPRWRGNMWCVTAARLGLATGAVPRAPPGDARLLDLVAAPRARLTLAAVDPELALHRALGSVGGAVVAKRCALAGDPEPERPADSLDERAELLGRQLVSRPKRVEAGPPQRLVGVDVPHAGEQSLVEDEGLQRRAPAGDPVGE